MEADIRKPDFTQGEIALVEPHFDEESTLLSARPVVPLEEVRSEGRSRRRLMFGVALVVALVVGLVVGTLIFKQGYQQGTDAAVEEDTFAGESSQPVTIQAGAAGGAPVDETAAAVPGAENNSADIPTTSAPVAKKEVSPPARVDSPTSRRTQEARPLQTPDRAESDIEARRAARKEERRRLRREERREARRNRDSDDLLKIREIFEGSPRP